MSVQASVETPRFEKAAQPAPTHIVGVGASAGGLEALETMFGAMPIDTGMAFVVQQHLSPDFESRMQELLGRATKLQVSTASDGTKLLANAIYLAPPNKEMMLSGDTLLLTDRDSRLAFTLPIDHFFRSLAQEAGSRAIGVILSGTGSDGRRGVHAIHEGGGSVIAQTPESCKFDGMPKSAIATGVVDAVLDPDDVGAALMHHAAQAGPGTRLSFVREPSPDEEGGLGAILSLLRAEYGIDFAHYKLSTVQRRVERRIGLGNIDDVIAYTEQLRESPAELNALYRDLLIGVTRFFRDGEAFEVLARDVIPALLDKYGPDEEIRVWVAGCATGEEPYSLAMLFDEQARQRDRRLSLKIFATDVHRASLEVASEGRYPAEALNELREDRKARYFRPDGDGFCVTKELRQMIVFACHNVIADAPFTRVDLVTCRNLLIYFQLPAQQRALSLFHFALRTDGCLWLGPAETPGPIAEEFEEIDRHWRIYRKRRDIRLSTMALGSASISQIRPNREVLRAHSSGGRAVPNARLVTSYDALLRQFMPPSILVDDGLSVLHVFNGAERFMRIPDGRASTQLLDLVQPELRSVIARAARHAVTEGCEARGACVVLELEGVRRDHVVRVRPLRDARSKAIDLLVMIEVITREEDSGEHAIATPAEKTEKKTDDATRDYVAALEAELRFTKENLQATIEELEASNEELQATNEELMAANEELQSTNEELHSVNEELYTVNVEHQEKITELTELTDDMDNLLHSIDVGVVFLDKELHIRKFTRRITDTFRITNQDVGRQIGDFAHTIRHPSLTDDVASVLATGQAVEREVEDTQGEHKFLRVLPYVKGEECTGVVLSIINIGALKRAEQRIRRLSAIVEHSHDAIMATDLSGTISDWNRGAETLYGHSAEEAVGQNVSILLPQDSADAVAHMMDRVRRGQGVQSFDTVFRRRNGQNVDVSVAISPLLDQSGNVIGASTSARDIRWRKRTEARIRRAIEQRERFLAMLSHELRNPLMGLMTAAGIIRDPNSTSEVVGQAASVICRQSTHMAAMLDDLLDVSRMRQDRIEMRREPMDLRSTVDDVLDEVRGSASAREIRIDVQLPEQAVPVHGDRTRLRQLLANLLTNALKYSWDGQTVRIAMAVDADEARLSVRDDGAGIDAETMAEIFEPFVQGEYQPPGGEGMGLGLALVRSIAAAHGGRVAAHSAGQGRGSELTVWLPLDRSGASQPKLAPTSQPPLSVLRGLRVLVVEDQDDNRELLELGLQRYGMQVTGASNVSTARALLDSGTFDVGLVDIGLPDERGHEVARYVRQRRTPNMLLIALTGHGQQSERDGILQAGFNHHLVKPTEIAKICQVIADSFQRMHVRNAAS